MRSRGQMLIEVVVAVGILALVLIGVSDLMTRSQRVGSFQSKKEEAMSIARMLLNDYRLQKEANPTLFLSEIAGLNREVCVEGKEYSCVVEVSKNDTSADLIISVSWLDGANTLKVVLNNTIFL